MPVAIKNANFHPCALDIINQIRFAFIAADHFLLPDDETQTIKSGAKRRRQLGVWARARRALTCAVGPTEQQKSSKGLQVREAKRARQWRMNGYNNNTGAEKDRYILLCIYVASVCKCCQVWITTQPIQKTWVSGHMGRAHEFLHSPGQEEGVKR